MLAGTGAHKSGDQPTSLDLLHMGIRLIDSDPVTLSRSVQWMGGRDVFQYLAVSIQFCYKGAGSSKSTTGFLDWKGSVSSGCAWLPAFASLALQ